MEDDSETNFIGWQFLLIVFLMNIIESISIYESIYFVKNLWFSYMTIAFIFWFAAFLRFLFEIPIWLFWDTYWNKKNIVLWIFFVLLWYICILISKLETVILWVILISIWDAFWISSLNASAVEFLKFNWYNNLTKFFSFKAFFVSLWYIVWLILNILLIKFYDIKYIFLFWIFLLLFTFFISLLLPAVKNNKKRYNFNFDIKIFFVNKYLFKIAILTLFVAIAMEGIHNYIYLFFWDEIWDENVWFVAIIEVIWSLIAPFLLLKILLKIFKFNILSFSLFLTFLSILLLSYLDQVVLKIISFVIFNIFIHIYFIMKDNLLHENIFSHRATSESVLNTLESIWEIIWWLIIWLIIHFFWFKIGLLSISIIFLITFLVSIFKLEKIYWKNKINL